MNAPAPAKADGEMPRNSLYAIKDSLLSGDEVRGLTWDVDSESGGTAAPAPGQKTDETFYEDFVFSEFKEKGSLVVAEASSTIQLPSPSPGTGSVAPCGISRSTPGLAS